MKKFHQAFSIQFVVLFFALLVPQVSAETFVVTRTDDPVPDGCAVGDCSLREAIIAANDDNSENHTIQLTGGLTYTLSISGDVFSGPVIIEDEDIGLDEFSTNDEEGALKILNKDRTIRIESTGGGMAEIDADGTGPVFMILDETVAELDGLKITGGDYEVGGGLIVAYNESLTITNSLITGNTAESAAGMDVYGGIIVIEDSEISENESDSDGVPLAGAMFLDRAPLYQDATTIAELEDIEWVQSNVTIRRSDISNNTAEAGGAFYITRSTLNVIESTVSGNRAYARGGGFSISRGATVNLDRSTISGNIARNESGSSGRGGAFIIDHIQDSDEVAEVVILNSTISGNETGDINSGTGGGIYVGQFGAKDINIINSTITKNTAGVTGSGGILVYGGTFNVTNSIIADQVGGNDCEISELGSEPLVYTSLGYNLESEDTCGFTSTGDLQNSDPLLGPLQDNGGPVFTHAITSPLSPAVNNGSNTLYTNAGGNLGSDSDANGNDRVYDFGSGGIIDIGSFELQQDATFDGCPVTNEDKILFVKKGESGTGANWADALGELRDALALFEDETCTIEDVEEVWVTAGTYLPTDDSGDREATFNMIEGLDIYGGFVGSEDREFERDLESNISILSGDINDDDNLSGNSYHVVSSIDNTFGNLSDFTITGGNANGPAPHDKGGGFYANNGGTSMNTILFQGNYAETAGGGAYVEEDGTRPHFNQPRFFNSIFTNNSTGDDGNGGGLALIKTETRITTSTFENNEADNFGGGLYNDGSDPIIKNTIFKENSAGSEGGGIFNDNSDPELFNVLITNNDAFSNGGGMVNALLSDPFLTNVTITGNEASGHSGSDGGGIYNRNTANPILLNTIVWGNTAGGTGNEIWNATNSTAELNFSLYGNDTDDIVEGDGFVVANSLTSNPMFEDVPGMDFSLSGSSPAINMGDPDTEMSDFNILAGFDEIDLVKNPRVFNGDVDIIDMGAYEFQGNVSPPSSCPATDGILFVKKGESGTGASWDNALGELRDALTLLDNPVSTGECTLEEVDEIWVSAGVYLPTDDNSEREALFGIPDGVNLIGGFEGVSSETSTDSRDWQTNQSILSGDINEDGELAGNSYHVTAAFELTNETTLDGFHVTGGNADGSEEFSNGGGLYSTGSMLTVKNVVFENNFAQMNGGGAFITDSGDQTIFRNVQFSNNESDIGGGLASENSSLRINECIFTNNTANSGGGVSFSGGSPLVDQSIFTGNTGNNFGGGLTMNTGGIITNSVFSGNKVLAEEFGSGGAGIQVAGDGAVELRNILVSGNSSNGFGGGIQFLYNHSSIIINSTITGNQSQKAGGGVHIYNSSPTVQNSIVWNNDSIDNDNKRLDNFSKVSPGTPVISNSLIQGCNPAGTWDIDCGTDGGDNLADTDPLFDTGIAPGDSPTTDGDFSLTSASPVINLGSNTLYTDSGGDLNNENDLAGENRLYDGNTDVIDLGAYEFQGEPEGDEPEFAPFITTWEVEAGDLEITIPTVVGPNSYDYDVDWGDGETDTGLTGDASHTYDSAGTYTVKITGTFPQIEFFNADDKDKILSVEQWGDIEWASMRKAFQGATNLEINAEDEPDLSNATSMLEMFSGATSVNGGLENWDVSTITSMFGVFNGATSFNGDISGWNVSAVTDMILMFAGATAFNQDIGNWEIGNVEVISSMFQDATSFNQDISGWDTGKVTGMFDMFHNAENFNQNLGDWDISNVTTMGRMLNGSGLSTENYDATLTGWAAQTVKSDVDLGADGLTYCESEADRQSLITDDIWEILGDDLAESCGEFRPFITTWKTDNPGDSDDQSIRIPMIGNGYDFNVDWGDGNDEDYINDPGVGVSHFIEHTYTTPGEYEVKISGTFPRIHFNNLGDGEKILTIQQWGDIEWSSMKAAFTGASNVTYSATDEPDLSAVTSMAAMFNNARDFNGDLSSWDVSNVNDMSSMFSNATSFNGNVSTWNVSNVTNMEAMFNSASAFNQDLSDWIVGNVENMGGMFNLVSTFNQDISGWNVESVTDMRFMFFEALAFNQDISDWDVSNVEQIRGMFSGAENFNQNISNWDVSGIEDMVDMFANASSFNQNLGGWDISSITTMAGMLDNSGLSTENYDNTLIGWESQSVQNGVTLGSIGLTYCNGETARQALIDDHSWTINDDGIASGCTSPEGEDQRILASNGSDYEFSKSDFGISNDAFSIKIETLPDEGTLELDGDPVSPDDEISIQNINNDEFTWDMPDNEYGYNFTSFEFRIVDDNENQSDTSYTLTIDLADQGVELMSTGWRFMTNPSDGDSYADLFSGVTVEIAPPPSQSLYELDQQNYEWDPVGSTGDEPGVGTPFIIYVLEDDIPDLPLPVESGDNWSELDGTFSYSGLEYDGVGTSPNPGNFYLLGNPHPIALDFCEFTEENVATSAYFWNPEANGGNGDYESFNCATENVLIAPFQAFWIRTTDSTPSLEIPMEAYFESTTEGYFKEKSGQEEPFLITMHIAGEDGLFTNRAQILFSDEATEGLDRFDAPKLSAEGLASQWLSFHSLGQDEMQYAYQSLPLEMLNEEKVRVPMDIETTEPGRYTLNWNLPESAVFSGSYFIRDNDTGEVVELQDGASYSFQISLDQSMKASGDERSATTHPMSELADHLNAQSNTHRMNSGASPRFELLIAGTGVDGLTELGAVPEDFTLAQNYPNPFNPTTVISYQLPISSEVRLEVYDMLGRNVATLINGQVSAGRHMVNFDASNLSSGVYLYRLQAGSQIMTKKLTILK